jgi:hypothetical protein
MNNYLIKVQVDGVVISEKCYGALVDLLFNDKGMCYASSRLVWFPKSICVYELKEKKDGESFDSKFITAPKWFLDKNNINYKI